MNLNLKKMALCGLSLLAFGMLIPSATAEMSVHSVCPWDDPWQDGTGWNRHYSRSCIIDETETGGIGVDCSYSQSTTGPGYGQEFPIGYKGQQTCLVSEEANGPCVSYGWDYSQDQNGQTTGSRDKYRCFGLEF